MSLESLSLDEREPIYRASATVDERQIAHFDSQAEGAAGSEEGRGWLYKYNPVRLAFLREVAGRPAGLNGLRVLDVGCGTGVFCEALAADGGDVLGTDLAKNAIGFATRHAATLGLRVRYEARDAATVPETFDAVTAMEVVEHVPDFASFMESCAGRVAPGGVFMLSTINRTWKSYVYAIFMAERVLHLLPKGAHEWKRFVRPDELAAVLRRLGFVDITTRGVTMNLKTKDLQFSRDESVNFLIAGRRPA